MFKSLKTKIVLFLVLIIPISSIADNIKYLFNIDFSNKDSITVNLTINCNDYHKSFLFSSDAVITELKIDNQENKNFVLRNDSLVFTKDSTKYLFVKYVLLKNQYILDSSQAIILKKEGKWYPAIQNSIGDATISIHNANRYWIIAGKRIKNNLYKLEAQPSLSVFLLPNDFFQKTEVDTLNTKIDIYASHQCPFKNDNKFIFEFIRSIKYYTNLFNDKPFDIYNIIAIPDKNFLICQSFTGGVIFGQDYFYNLYKMDKSISWIPHEVAHQWWGFSILSNVNSFCYRFFEESITEFIKVSYIKINYGDSVCNKLVTKYIDMFNYVVKDTLDIPISEVYSLNSQANSIIIYCKGPLILNKFVIKNGGFKKFNDFISLFYNKYKNHLANFDLFNKELIEYYKGKNVDLNKLIYSKGNCWD